MKLLLLSSFLSVCVCSFAQKEHKPKETFYLFDENGNPAHNSFKAYSFTSVLEVNDTTYVARTYTKGGPLVMQQTFKDEELQHPNGRFAWYNENGNIDSTGLVVNGRKTGYWLYYDDSCTVYNTKFYEDGNYIGKYNPKDLIGREDIEPAQYPTGEKGWLKYLSANLEYNIPLAVSNFPKLQGNSQAVDEVSFKIDNGGRPIDFYLLKSSGYPFDIESLRVIRDSKNWIPAEANGRKIAFTEIQRFIFNLIGGDSHSVYIY